ncbi:MAG TPA: QueT transporter family protein [Terriglobales bacterium]|nr:QueT transporter family protein [Terriglobales bacterium]
MKGYTAKQLSKAGLIAAIYAGLTLATAGFSFGPTQLRVAEAMTLLPLLFPEAVPGLFVGCFLSNLIGGYGLADAVVGSLATLAAALVTKRCKGPLTGGLPPVLINAVAIGILLKAVGAAEAALPLVMVQLAAEEAVSVYLFGLPLLGLLRRLPGPGGS